MSIQLKNDKHNIDIRELPDGRACVHFLFETADGPVQTVGTIKTPAEGTAGRPTLDKDAKRRWRIPCNPKQNTINPQERNGVKYMCLSSQDVRAVTCPKCRESPEAVEAMERITNSECAYIEKGRAAQKEAEENHKKAVASK